MLSSAVVSQEGEARVLLGRQQGEQRRDPLRPDACAVIVTPDMNVERTGRGMRAGPDRRQVRQEG